MGFPVQFDKAAPADADNPSAGAAEIRSVKSFFEDLFGILDTQYYSAKAMDIGLAGQITVAQQRLLFQNGSATVPAFGFAGATGMGLAYDGSTTAMAILRDGTRVGYLGIPMSQALGGFGQSVAASSGIARLLSGTPYFSADNLSAEVYGFSAANSAADNATALAAAISALPTYGGIIVLPPGEFALTTVTLPDSAKIVSIFGAGPYSTRLTHSGSDPLFTFTGAGSLRPHRLSGLHITGSDDADTIYIEGSNNLLLEHLILTPGASQKGLHFVDGVAAFLHHVFVEGGDSGATGLYVEGVAGAGQTTLYANWCRFANCLTQGVRLVASNGLKFRDSIFESNGGPGLIIDGSSDVSLDGCWFETNTTRDISVLTDAGTGRNLKLVDCRFASASMTDNINIAGIINLFLLGNRFEATTLTTAAVVLGAGVNGARLLGNRYEHASANKDVSIDASAVSVDRIGESSAAATGLGRVTNVTGISSGTDQAKNLRGTITVADTDTSGSVAFSTAESDANYYVVCSIAGAAGSPTIGQPWADGKTVNGFTINLTSAPGSGKSVVIDWVLIR